ncbi:nitrogen fixation protein NifQ [Paraburkholderia sp. Ac-20340]|uniref:nitrogen fixation protein NifQ n=1 Tax=Paraburkholderia sp. Ac-20340 TaxID=2703888 RepID=UPI0019826DDD|nr:nitrogen fixation protein NifQ [Paraburkholderia sp. Ac-20340]MBN3858870.1 nitrogen fixation protein NifQ [Paraburkholderia sp. Ac-20340]
MTGSQTDFESLAAACRDRLTGAPREACTADAWLFARLVAAREVRGERALLGLPASALAALAERHFAAGALVLSPIKAVTLKDASHAAFAAAMRDFLIGLAARNVDADDARCLATILAHACLRPDHLWRDLGLSGRDDVTQMLTRFFPEVVARNTENLRWKKLLARELALARGDVPGPAPGCPGCEDFGFCFPSEPAANRTTHRTTNRTTNPRS